LVMCKLRLQYWIKKYVTILRDVFEKNQNVKDSFISWNLKITADDLDKEYTLGILIDKHIIKVAIGRQTVIVDNLDKAFNLLFDNLEFHEYFIAYSYVTILNQISFPDDDDIVKEMENIFPYDKRRSFEPT